MLMRAAGLSCCLARCLLSGDLISTVFSFSVGVGVLNEYDPLRG